jgi:hypothetical protein
MSKYIFSGLILLLCSCIDPYILDLPQGERLLTVDGYITTDPGPHIIRLTRTDTYGSVFEGLIRPVSQATVAIRDSEGFVVFLEELEERGAYATPANFRAIVGKAYSLQIDVPGGQSYSSLPEKVLPVPQIDSLSYRSIQLATENRLSDRSGVQVFAHFKDPVDQQNNYYWRTKPGVFVLVANPELHTFPPDHPTNPRGPNPKDCCAICFMVDNPIAQRFTITSDEDFNGLTNRLPVTFIEDDGLRFKRMYRAEIQQMRVSPGAFRFLRLIEQQLSITGSVFDQPPANIRGNIINLNNPDETVLGYFIAAAVNTKQVYIDREKLQFVQTPKIIPNDCQTVRGATLARPADWNP